MDKIERPALRFYFWRRNGMAEYNWRAPGCEPEGAIDITDLDDSEFEKLVARQLPDSTEART